MGFNKGSLTSPERPLTAVSLVASRLSRLNFALGHSRLWKKLLKPMIHPGSRGETNKEVRIHQIKDISLCLGLETSCPLLVTNV